MKIVQVIARLNVGGAAAYTILLASELERLGHDVILVNGVAEPDEGELLDYLDPSTISCRHVEIRHLRRRISPLRDTVTLVELIRLLRRERPDVVHTHTSKAGLLGRVAAAATGVPATIHSLHGTVFQGHFSALGSRALVQVERLLGAATDVICTDTSLVRDQVLAAGVARPERVAVVPLGLDLEQFRDVRGFAGKLRAQIGKPPPTRLVGMVARLVPVKGIDCFLAAIPAVVCALPDAHFVLIGDGELRSELEARAEMLGIADRLSMVGFWRDLREVYADLDVLVLSSLSEGCPVAILEGMAAGVPVVASAVGGVPDVVRHDATGLLFASRDSHALAAALVRLLEEPETGDRLAVRAREEVFGRFTIASSARETEACYRRVLEGGTGRRAWHVRRRRRHRRAG